MKARGTSLLLALASSLGLVACASGDGSLFGGSEEHANASIPAGSFGGICVASLGGRVSTQDVGGSCGMGYGGRASALSLREAIVNLRLGDSGELASSGGTRDANTASANVAGVVQASALHGTTRSAGRSSVAESSVVETRIDIAGHTVTAAVLRSNASTSCAESAGASIISDLRIDGVVVEITGKANQTIVVGPVRVVLDEQVRGAGAISVTALHVSTLGTDVALASARARVDCPCGGGSIPIHDAAGTGGGGAGGSDGSGASATGGGGSSLPSSNGGDGAGSHGFGDLGDACDEKNKCTGGNVCVSGELVVR